MIIQKEELRTTLDGINENVGDALESTMKNIKRAAGKQAGIRFCETVIERMRKLIVAERVP